MLHLIKPTGVQIESFLKSQKSEGFTYPSVGSTRSDQAPAGFNVDRNRIVLGKGEAVYDLACTLLSNWQMFPAGWTQVHASECGVQKGDVVCVLIRAFGCWWANASRIIYKVDEVCPSRIFGFAYGTLSGHVESGEERFVIEWDPQDNTVWYEIFSFSRPRHPLVRLAYPFARRLQAKFIHDSLLQMKSLVTTASSASEKRELPNVVG